MRGSCLQARGQTFDGDINPTLACEPCRCTPLVHHANSGALPQSLRARHVFSGCFSHILHTKNFSDCFISGCVLLVQPCVTFTAGCMSHVGTTSDLVLVPPFLELFVSSTPLFCTLFPSRGGTLCSAAVAWRVDRFSWLATIATRNGALGLALHDWYPRPCYASRFHQPHASCKVCRCRRSLRDFLHDDSQMLLKIRICLLRSVVLNRWPLAFGLEVVRLLV